MEWECTEGRERKKMNWVLLIVLGLLAFFLIQENLLFLGFLVFIAMIVVALYKPSYVDYAQPVPMQAQAERHKQPYYIKMKAEKIPGSYYVRIYPSWENRNMWEEMGKWGLGVPLNTLGSTVYRLFTGKHAEAGTELEPELLMRGR